MPLIDPDKEQKLKKLIALDPMRGKMVVTKLKNAGITFSSSLLPPEEGGDVFDEAAAFLAGLPEGATYGVVDVDAGKGAAEYDAPLLGKVQPSREAGRLIGGMATGGILWNLGFKTMGRAATTGAMKSLAKSGVGTKALRKMGARGVGATASALPEGLVGSIATGIREGDLEAAARAFPEWMALGVGSDALMFGFQKMYRRWKSGAKISKDARDRLAKQVEDEASGETLHHDMRDREVIDVDEAGVIHNRASNKEAKHINAIKETDPWITERVPLSAYEADIGDAVDTQQILKSVDRKVAAATKEAQQRTDVDAQPKASEAEELASPDGNIVISPAESIKNDLREELSNSIRILLKARKKPGGLDSNREETLVNAVRDADLHLRNYANNGPRDATQEYFKGLRIVRSDKPLDRGVGANYKQGDDFITLDPKKLDQIYKDKSWSAASLEEQGIKPLARKIFSSPEEFEDFAMQHEWLHSLIPYDTWRATYITPVQRAALLGAKHRKAEYENFINQLAIDMQNISKATSSKPEVKNKITPKTLESTSHNQAQLDALSAMGVRKVEVGQREAKRVEEARRDISELSTKDLMAKEEKDVYKMIKDLEDEGLFGDALPFQGAGQEVPINLKVEIAGMVDRIHKLVPRVAAKYNIANLLPDNPTLEQANIIRNNLAEAQYWGDVMHHDRIAQQLEANGPSAGLIEEMPYDVHAALEQVGKEGLHQAPGFFSRIVGPFSRNGLGANRMTRWFANETMRTMDEKQAKVGNWMSEYIEIRKLVGMQDQSRIKAMMGRVGGGTDPEQAAREKLYELARVLDTPGTAIPSGWDDNMKQAYQRYRKMMVAVADDLGLDRDRRIGDYLHHFFAGRSGQYRASQLSSRLGSEPGQAGRLLKKVAEEGVDDEATMESYVRDLLDNVQREAPNIRERGFGALLKREADAPGFEYDLDHITRVYLMGAGEKWFSNSVFPRAQQILHHLPDSDMMGNATSLRREFSEYVNHLMGQSTETRQKVAVWFGQNTLFNKGFDALVESIGAAPKRGILKQARGAGADDHEARRAATQFLDELDDAGRTYDKMTGEVTNNAEKKRMATVRAKMALRLEDLRQALANPAISGPVANQLYRVQILSKLGLNMAHGMINTTQTLINTWPMLKKGYTSRAIVNYTMKGSRRQIKGYDVDDLLELSGIRGDAAKVEEFIELNGTWLGDFQGFMMAPSKISEQFNRSVAFLGFYEQFRDAGKGHILAMKEAVDGVQKTQFPFNRAGTPPVLRGPLVRLTFMFKSYPIHQTDFSQTLLKDGVDSFRSARDAGKTLAEALEDDDVITAAKHVFAYAAAVGGSMALFPDLNLADRMKPPLSQMPGDFVEGMGRYGALGSLANTLGGPFNETVRRGAMSASSGLEYFAGLTGIADNTSGEAGTDALRHLGKTAQSFIEPTSVRKLRENGFPDTNDDWMQLLSLKKYKPAAKKQSIPRPLAF
tara:strand:+ start:3105 stop:7505 length:4401 start_codon:yes stop_codon:yes gene_type:complete